MVRFELMSSRTDFHLCLFHGDAKAATDTTKIWTDIKAIRAESDDIEKDIDKLDTVSEAEAFTWSFQE